MLFNNRKITSFIIKFTFFLIVILFCSIIYKTDQNKTTITFYDNNIKKNSYEVSVITSENTEHIASYISEFDENKNKKAAGFLFKGEKNGLWEQYHSDGVLKSIGQYKDNIKTGSWRFFHENSNIASEGRYDDNGSKIGYWISFYSNGKIKEQGCYKNGQKIGDWIFYPDDKKDDCYWLGYFNQFGKPDKEWKWYVANRLYIVDKYNNGIAEQRFVNGKKIDF